MKNLEIKAVFVLASNHFRKSFSVNAGVCGCLVAYGKWIFRKRILVDRKIKAFDPKNIISQNFTFKSFPETRKEREREKGLPRANRKRERERDREPRKVEIVAPPARLSTRDCRTHK